jgi:hypothetical protein
MVVDYGTHRRGAEVMIAGFAPFAGKARISKPSQTDPLSERYSSGMRTHGRDRADNFVTGNQGILADSPFVVHHTEVAVAQPAVFYLDLDFGVPQGPGSNSNGYSVPPGFVAA